MVKSSLTKIFLTCLLAVHICSGMASESVRSDSVAAQPNWFDRIVQGFMKLPAFGVPMAGYAPETSLMFGGAAQGYFKCPGQETSMLQLTGAYTLNKQWYIQSMGTIYAGEKRTWQITYSTEYRVYPDLNFEMGNPLRLKESTSYTSRRGYGRVSALCDVGKNWYIGPQTHYLHEETDIQPTVNMLGLGGVIQYDSRDGHYYPFSGLFFQLAGMYYESFNNHFSRLGLIQTDLRQYVPLYKKLIFAWQFRTEWSVGKQKPFQLHPTLGGENLLRGLRLGMFRDDALWALQGEVRFPIVWLFSGAVFAGMGDVYNYADWQWAVPKVGYGVGLRMKINEANINVRVDLARNNLYKSWNTWESYALYVLVNEAF